MVVRVHHWLTLPSYLLILLPCGCSKVGPGAMFCLSFCLADLLALLHQWYYWLYLQQHIIIKYLPTYLLTCVLYVCVCGVCVRAYVRMCGFVKEDIDWSSSYYSFPHTTPHSFDFVILQNFSLSLLAAPGSPGQRSAFCAVIVLIKVSSKNANASSLCRVFEFPLTNPPSLSPPCKRQLSTSSQPNGASVCKREWVAPTANVTGIKRESLAIHCNLYIETRTSIFVDVAFPGSLVITGANVRVDVWGLADTLFATAVYRTRWLASKACTKDHGL